jgi:DNA-3-methyladenine glycosylase II
MLAFTQVGLQLIRDVVEIIPQDRDLAYGLAQLISLDPRLKAIAALSGPLPARHLPQGFEGLANIIVSQLISRASANAIWGRMALDPALLTAEGYLNVTAEMAKSFGLSAAKHNTILNLANALASGELDLASLKTLSGEEAHRRLTALKGIGPWTADVYLLFALGHHDVFPIGDVALQAAAQHALGLEARPTSKQLSEISQIWRPWRSYAARSLWAYYGAVLKRSVTPLP